MKKTNYDSLKVAAQVGDIDLLYRVIQKDPNILKHIDSKLFGECPLHIAASMGNLRFANEIMRLKPSFAWKLNQQGFSPIHLAMQNGQERMVRRFVDINKDLVRVKGRDGLTPLHFASQTGKVDLLADFLGVCPVAIEDVTVSNETALHIAVKENQYVALQVLVNWIITNIERGAGELETNILNWKDMAGNTVLHISALSNEAQAVRLLVGTKIDLNAKNLLNETALDMTTNPKIKDILSNAGAKPGSQVTDAPTPAHSTRVKIPVISKIFAYIYRIRMDMLEEKRNVVLIVATLVATTAYQSVLTHPGGVYRVDAGVTATPVNAGKSVLSGCLLPFFLFSNAFSFLVPTITIGILSPGGRVSCLVLFVYCYFFSVWKISPISVAAASLFKHVKMELFPFILLGGLFLWSERFLLWVCNSRNRWSISKFKRSCNSRDRWSISKFKGSCKSRNRWSISKFKGAIEHRFATVTVVVIIFILFNLSKLSQ